MSNTHIQPPQLGDIVDWGDGQILICRFREEHKDHGIAKFYRWGGVLLNDPSYDELVYMDIREWEEGNVKKVGHVDLLKWMKKS